MKTLGKLIGTNDYRTKCECGEEVKQVSYESQMFADEDGYIPSNTDKKEMMIGFCKCGNAFVSQRPIKRCASCNQVIKRKKS